MKYFGYLFLIKIKEEKNRVKQEKSVFVYLDLCQKADEAIERNKGEKREGMAVDTLRLKGVRTKDHGTLTCW